MHPLAYKVGFYAALCGIALSFACLCASAQDSAAAPGPLDNSVSIAPVDNSVHAGVDEIKNDTNDKPVSPDASKRPQPLSRWAPQTVKPQTATSTWAVKVHAASAASTADTATAIDDASSTATPIKKDTSARSARSVPGESKTVTAAGEAHSGNSARGYRLPTSLLQQTRDKSPDTSTTTPIFPEIRQPNESGFTNPFDTNPFGRQWVTPYSTKKTFSDQDVGRQPVEPISRPVPSSHTHSSTDSPTNLKQ
jgi:hypothetical protein